MTLKLPYSYLVNFAFFVGSSLFGVSIAFRDKKTHLVDVEVPDVDDISVPIDPNNPKVVQIAKFAIDEHNKEEEAKLSFNSVVKAAYSVDPQGTNYDLIIEAIDASELNAYDANVRANKDGSKKLIAFKKKF